MKKKIIRLSLIVVAALLLLMMFNTKQAREQKLTRERIETNCEMCGLPVRNFNRSMIPDYSGKSYIERVILDIGVGEYYDAIYKAEEAAILDYGGQQTLREIEEYALNLSVSDAIQDPVKIGAALIKNIRFRI